jgi:translation initiation factor IF-1
MGAANAIGQRIPGGQMEMNKVRVRQGDSLTFHRRDTQTQSFCKIAFLRARGLCGKNP